MKICTKCLVSKPLIEFYSNKALKDGKNYICKKCIDEYRSSHVGTKESVKAYYQKNKEKIQARSKEYYLQNKQKVKSYWVEYKEKNKTEYLKYQREYQREYRGKSVKNKGDNK
jgi:superfamily II helicase